MKGSIKIGHWYSFPRFITMYLNDEVLFYFNDDGDFHTIKDKNWSRIVKVKI